MIKLIKWFLAFLFFKRKSRKTNDLIDKALDKNEVKYRNIKYLQKFQTKKRYRKCPALKPY